MDIHILKEIIIERDAIPVILEDLGCGHIRYHDNNFGDAYYTASNPDGDNQNAINVYKNDQIVTINYTRNISKINKSSDIFTLIEFIKQINFFESLKYVCDLLNVDYYKEPERDLPESIYIHKRIMQMMNGNINAFDDEVIRPIPEKILDYYIKCVNDYWYNDGVNYKTQIEFELGYDPDTNRITIPIRDELGTLCAVKGRLYKKNFEKGENKFLYIERGPRNSILYGLNKTMPYIKEAGKVYVLEAEKGVHQLWSYGYKNSIAIGGKEISQRQIIKLSRLGVDVIFAFDKDVKLDELEEIAEKFIIGISVFTIKDDCDILDENESPSDNKEKFEKLKDSLQKLSKNIV